MVIYGSVCSGIEAASVAWHPLGWRASFFSEIESFPRAVLAHHYPKVPLHGDFTTIEAGQYEPIDLLVGGTPCQSFSVAGLRGGLADERGNLALEYIRLAQRLRPRWLLWENVPGVLSATSHDAPDPCKPPDNMAEGSEWVGEDEYDSDESHAFSCFLAGLSEIGYGWAYRSFDAQYFGLAQRRERVFVVGYLGDWRRAAAVLFEPESLRGHPAPRRQAGEGFTHELAPCIGASGRGFERTGDPRGQDAIVARCLNAKQTRIDGESETFVVHALKGEGHDASEDGTGRGVPLVPTYAVQERAVSENLVNGPQGKGYQADVAYTLEARNKVQAVAHQVVRRLTPRECERLQGFPDDYTLIPYRNKPAADGPRYKALGNSMAVPVMRWIGRRIAMVDNTT